MALNDLRNAVAAATKTVVTDDPRLGGLLKRAADLAHETMRRGTRDDIESIAQQLEAFADVPGVAPLITKMKDLARQMRLELSRSLSL